MLKSRFASGSLNVLRRAWSGSLLCFVLVMGQEVSFSAGIETKPKPDIFSLTATQFEEPFIATAPTTLREDAALSQSIEHYRSRKTEDDFGSMTGYLADFPKSGWRVAILTNLGLSYYHYGYFSKAIASLEQAWQAGRTAQEPRAKPLVDRAIGELLRMHARLGHADRLEQLMKEIGDRPLTGPATEALTGAHEGLWMMRHDPGTAYLCGPMALKNLLIAQGARPDKVQAIERYRSGPHGVTLQEVAQLASDADLPYKLVFRQTGQSIPVPSIVHWRESHFAAIVEQRNNRFHVQDPTFGQDLWIGRSALESEASGYFLVPGKRGNLAWRSVGDKEASQVRGMGFTSSQQMGANTLGETTTCSISSGSDSSASSASSTGASMSTSTSTINPGMCDYSITMLTVGVRLLDTPVGYTPPKGPDAHVMLVYNQREDSQPATFGWFNVSQKWTLNWLSYIEDDPNYPGYKVTRFAGGGGSVAYLGYTAATSSFLPETRDASVLVRTSEDTYERRLQDGGFEIYSQSNGATSSPRRIFLTKVVDRFGNAATLSYDSQLRLTTVTDATGRQTTFAYELPAPQQLLITKITDPFGRSAELEYDALGRLAKITDVLGLSSQFTYDNFNLINTLTTPYGVTRFAYSSPNDTSPTRFVNATDPLGQTERVEFQHTVPGIAGSDPAATVPQGLNLINAYLYYRNSFYWDKHAYAIAAGDYTKARITHFHHWISNSSETAHSVESIKLPLENRVWFTYPGQIYGSYFSGTYDKPTSMSRVLDDGTTQATKLTYNAQGNLTDSIDPVGRETQFAYDANGIDLLQINQKTSATEFSSLAKFAYNSQHLPLTSTDAADQVGTYTYNTAGQPNQFTDALGHVTAYEYDGLGYLTRIVNANNQTAASFAYDEAGRIASRTDSEGYIVSYSYDAMDRLIKESYPDGTSRQYAYDKLDLASVTDRQGRKTEYAYDAVRQLVQITDPLQRNTKFTYYNNGTRKSLIDPNGNTTSWDIDLESRVTAKHYADSKGSTNTYEATTSRLKTVTDALGQSKQYSYTLDDQLADVSYVNAVSRTPNVSFTYDLYFPRLTLMKDGSGATTYSYQPTGSLGALQLALEDGPLKNDTIRYQYDALGRLSARNIDVATEAFSYDKLNRMTVQANDLGTFDMRYLGQTSQLVNQHLRNGLVGTLWTYDSNNNDRRLKAITNSGATRSYQYTTTPEKLITNITETANSGSSAFAAKTWNYSYDESGRLLQATGSSAQYTYSYDAADNITAQQGPDGSKVLTFNALNEVANLTYDANGNLLDDGQRTFEWDAENRLVAVSSKNQIGKSTIFRYDGLSRRVAVVTNGVESHYLWCGEQICQARSANDVVTRRYFNQGEVIPVSGVQLYYAQDQIGSTRDVSVVQNGSRISTIDYDPYGKISQASGRISPDFLYAGMFYDANDSLYLTQFRVYDPESARWLSRDHLQGLGGTSLYSYADSDPTLLVDRTGLCPPNGGILGAICSSIPSGRTIGVSYGIGGIGSVVGGGELVLNYDSGQISAFGYGGTQIGWNGGISGTVYTGFIWGLNNSNDNYSGGFTGINGGGVIGLFGAASSGGLAHLNNAIPSGPITVIGGSLSENLTGGAAFGINATDYTNPLQLGRFWAFSPVDALLSLARQLCK